MRPGMEETLSFCPGHSLANLFPEALNNIRNGVFIKARYQSAIFIIFQVIDRQVMTVLIKLLYKVKHGTICFFLCPWSISIVFVYAIIQFDSSTLCDIETGIRQFMQYRSRIVVGGLVFQGILNHTGFSLTGSNNDGNSVRVIGDGP